jgi:hypothetical protein
MSGSTGADRIKSRADFDAFVASYKPLIAKFPGFVDVRPSGSYNSNPNKQDFGDIDLITHIKSDDKVKTKKELVAFFVAHPETTIVPFSSVKHAGKRTYNSGEIVTVRYHDDQLGYSVQVDNIIASSEEEATFKQRFLDMPAEEQGLILGLVKIATIETAPAVLFQKLRIDAPTQLEADQEYEFNLSGVELQLRKVTYESGTFKQLSRDIIWNSKNFDDVATLLYQYDLKAGFENLLQQTKQNIRNPRSNARMQGVFSSMISVKSGEVGTAKGAGKETALAKVQQAFGESHNKTLFRSLMENNNRKIVFAFVRFQPPTIGHELLINTVKKTAEQYQCPYVIYVSRKQDHKENPLGVETKIQYLNMMFPGTNFMAAGPTTRTPIEAAVELNQKYTDLILVAGSDRESMFNLLQDYNHKNYEYNSIEFVSAGERDPDSPGVAGISGTKMREAAVANDFATFQKGLPDSVSAEGAQQLMSAVAAGLQKPVKAKKGVAEGLEKQQYLWHGSRQKIPVLGPRQSVDTGGAAGSNQNAIYATSDPKVAIAVGGLTTPDSDTAMFPNDPQMVLFSGNIRKGQNVYLHKLPFNGPDGKPQFVQGAHDREFYSIPGVKGIKPVEIKAVPVDKYLNLIRQATPQDLELRKKNMKQGVAEATPKKLKTGPAAHFTPKDKHVKVGQFVGGMEESKSVNCIPLSEHVENIMDALINKIIVNEAIQNNRK